MSGAPEPVFNEPWHAQVFALTVHLHEAGHFDWPDWARRFGATLERHGLHKDLDGGDDYFTAWIETLEALLAGLDLAQADQVAAVKADWEAAYLGTPHGEPVTLAGYSSTSSTSD
ncbi:nitrile hydratase accessory protein [Roseobacter sinensis]|uniref:Nitrile hydratase accessory protein n=1 Tax=Roseobacter sinensis TaxID=2931391 RepID=A0ABT3BA00_9RHOB|nr:nitrile hydratase accessory protein [Roseobacter sp. WL0113]MCV3270403.1 nitrile hydratase accessory protein [Roseobacter sp. WL0113]